MPGIGPIPKKRNVTLDRLVAHVERDHGLALRHPERPENAFTQDLRQFAAIERPRKVPKHLVDHVVVMKVLAGRISCQVADIRI